MPIVKNEVKTFVTNYVCDKCGKGNMKYDVTFSLGTITLHSHLCEHCNTYIELKEKYPLVEYANNNN